MPGFDGAGPTGAGPRTGRGMGPCAVCNGSGLGWRARMGFGGFRSPKNQQSALEAELEVLKEELAAVKKETNQ